VTDHPDQILHSNETVSFDENERQINRAAQLKKALPALTLFALLSLILYPIFSSRESSFTLSIDRLEQRDEKAKLIKPSYVDIDSNNRPVNISAASAYREENENTDYFFTDLIAQMSLPAGDAIEILANQGTLNTGTQIMDLGGEITIISETGFLLRATEATFFIHDKTASGKNGVTGIAPFGRFSANTFDAKVEQEIITLEGNVKISFDPNKPLNIFNQNEQTSLEGNSN
jgi:lipopolysaccharide export system protein LptC